VTPAVELGAATVGLGVGEQHARTLASTERCALHWVYDLDVEKAASLAAELGARAASGLNDILDDADVDLVTIASYDDAHFQQTVAALRAGKHVFVEKPLCRSVDELHHLKAVWQASGRHLVANLVLRGAPLYQWLRDAIAAGEFGEVYAVDGDYLYGRLPKITDGWRKDVPDYSVIQGGAVHMVDLMLRLTGQRPVSVTAVGNRIATRGTAFRYHDFVAATYRFDSGLIGRITANFGAVQPHQHVLRVFGTRATFIYDDRGPRLQTSRAADASWVAIDQAPLPRSKGVLIAPFVDAIVEPSARGRQTQHEFDLIAACVAADVAAVTGASETIAYV
jgi:predicted dehydrogenase